MAGGVPFEENVSEQLPKTDAEADLLKPAIAELLRTIPETWAEVDLAALTANQDTALFLLTAAGMVERRGWLRSTIANHPTCFEVRFQATGEGGFAKALEHATAIEYAAWGDAWRAWKAGETGHVSPFHTEAMKPQEWRLTNEGVIARGDLDGTNPNPMPKDVFDFVLKRGFFGPGYWLRVGWSNQPKFEDNKRLIAQQSEAYGKDWTELPRPPVSGDGLLVTIRKIEQPAGPHTVNVANWTEGGDAFATAFGKMLGPYLEAMSNAAQANAGRADSPHGGTPGDTATTTKSKGSTEKGEGRAKLIAALTKHHQYADGGCLNLAPIGNNELARLAGVSDSTASVFFSQKFDGHTKYRALCGDKSRLIAALKLLNQEYSPHVLFGATPPGERDQDEE